MKIQKQIQKGFILFITLMMLIIFAILGIGLYQQTTMSTLNVQYVTFKQEAEDLAMVALNELEANLKDKGKYKQRDVCAVITEGANKDELANKATNCDPISDEVIDEALTELREKGGLAGSTPNKPGWEHLDFKTYKGSFSGDGSVYFIIQQLGVSSDTKQKGYLFFRITIIARVLDAYSVISAVTKVPEKD